MDSRLPVVFIACKVFQGLLEKHIPDGLAAQVTFLDYGLHQVPRNLKSALQVEIERITQPSLVVLGYGLCGNGLDGIRAGVHTLLVPRVDDCIAILLGSYRAYQHQFDTSSATYYLSKGWLESGSNPLQEYETYVAKYGEGQANWLMDQQYRNYKRLAFVAHSLNDLQKYRPKARQVAAYCERWGMQYEEIQGSDAYVRRLVELASVLEQADKEFIVVPPGGILQQQQFLRMV
ncbi:MAG: DUF1638 domain-containing protein [Chloroflexota bacterium]